MDVEDNNTLYLAKNKSPLLIGIGEECHFVGSDAMAMINETNQFIEIKDGERIKLTPNTLTIFDEEGNTVSREPFVADIDSTDTEKGLYPHYMLKEIDEQPSVMRKLISEYLTEDGVSTNTYSS